MEASLSKDTGQWSYATFASYFREATEPEQIGESLFGMRGWEVASSGGSSHPPSSLAPSSSLPRPSSPRPTPPLLAGPAALIGALCPHKVAHQHNTTLALSHFHSSGSQYQTITKPHLPRP